MKGFVLALALLAITSCATAHPPPSPELLKEMFDTCKTATGISGADPSDTDEDDSKIKCFHACIMKTMGLMADGKVNVEKHLNWASQGIPNWDDAVKGKFTDCLNKANEESDECEVAHSLRKCLKENHLVPDHPQMY